MGATAERAEPGRDWRKMHRLNRLATRVAIGPAALAAALAGCAAPAAEDRAARWRAILAAEAPVGASGAAAEAAMRGGGLSPSRGTYVRIMADGARRSDCRDPRAAVTARDRSAGRGLATRLDVEVTVCLDPAGRVERHVVKVWNQGF